VTNCHEYNQSLKKRGRISLYFPDGDLLSQFIDASPYTRGVSGRTSSYRAPYVELIYTFYRLFSWGMRQIAGYMQDYWKTLGLDIPVPSSTDLPIDRVIADGAYYCIERGEALNDRGIVAVIPPPSHAVVHGDANTKLHDQTVQYIKGKGSIYAFHKKYGYGLRALVEAQISRIKRCIGAKLLTQKLESQEREGVVIANIINLWNSFGRPVSVKNA
jgi:hypothetical protein